MRQVESTQYELGGTFISKIEISPKSRDDIPALLIGLQHLYVNEQTRNKLFALLDAEVSPDKRKDTGRPGMELWRILVLAVLKQGLNCDYDRLAHLATRDGLVRQMMGHDLFRHTYERQTVADNVRLLSAELLHKVNQLLVEAGHEVVRKKPGETLRGHADLFCVETDVHYPTGQNLLWDSMRCSIRDAAELAADLDIPGWRQHQHISKKIKQAFNQVRTSQRVNKSPERLEAYLALCEQFLKLIDTLLEESRELDLSDSQMAKVQQLQYYSEHAYRQIEQTRRRVFEGERIPHSEKVFSIFEPHTRWVVKGKAGVTQELGVPVCVVEDQYNFVLHHKIMWQGGDVDHAEAFVAETRERFPELTACSFDKGFHSPANQTRLGEMLDECTLPRKGYLSAAVSAHQSQRWFKDARQNHSGIESAINHLERCEMDRVRDHGRSGFARAVALSVLSANLKRLGRILRDKERKRLARHQHRLRAA